MIAKANSERLVFRAHDLIQEDLNVPAMPLEELVLAVRHVDDQAEGERQLVLVREEADFLRNSIFEDLEVVRA